MKKTIKKKTVSKSKVVPFDKLKPEQKRVVIAQDVLAQLESKRFVATNGVWASKPGQDYLFDSKAKASAQVCDLTKKMKECSVCALGGMFVAAVERADKLNAGDLDFDREVNEGYFIRTENIMAYMMRFFDRNQLRSIESAFEQGCGQYHEEGSANFAPDCDDPSERMRLVMENIVVNKGKFVPQNQPAAVVVYQTPGYRG